jgi:Mn-containing catalase
MSSGNDFRGPWNQGKTTQTGETFEYIENPVEHVLKTNGLLEQNEIHGGMTERGAKRVEVELGKVRSEEIMAATSTGQQGWNDPVNGKIPVAAGIMPQVG